MARSTVASVSVNKRGVALDEPLAEFVVGKGAASGTVVTVPFGTEVAGARVPLPGRDDEAAAVGLGVEFAGSAAPAADRERMGVHRFRRLRSGLIGPGTGAGVPLGAAAGGGGLPRIGCGCRRGRERLITWARFCAAWTMCGFCAKTSGWQMTWPSPSSFTMTLTTPSETCPPWPSLCSHWPSWLRTSTVASCRAFCALNSSAVGCAVAAGDSCSVVIVFPHTFEGTHDSRDRFPVRAGEAGVELLEMDRRPRVSGHAS